MEISGDSRGIGADTKRPMNAFLIFCKRHRTIVREKNPKLDNRSVTRILGELWAELNSAEKSAYIHLANQYKDAFLKANPDYKWHGPDKPTSTQPTSCLQPKTFGTKAGSHVQSETITLGKLADPTKMGGLCQLLTSLDNAPPSLPATLSSPSVPTTVAGNYFNQQIGSSYQPTITTTNQITVPLWSASWNPAKSQSVQESSNSFTNSVLNLRKVPLADSVAKIDTARNVAASYATTESQTDVMNYSPSVILSGVDSVNTSSSRASTEDSSTVSKQTGYRMIEKTIETGDSNVFTSAFNGSSVSTEYGPLFHATRSISVPRDTVSTYRNSNRPKNQHKSSTSQTSGSNINGKDSALMQLAKMCTSELDHSRLLKADQRSQPRNSDSWTLFPNTSTSQISQYRMKQQLKGGSRERHIKASENSIGKTKDDSVGCVISPSLHGKFPKQNTTKSQYDNPHKLLASGQMLVDHIIDHLYFVEREVKVQESVEKKEGDNQREINASNSHSSTISSASHKLPIHGNLPYDRESLPLSCGKNPSYVNTELYSSQSSAPCQTSNNADPGMSLLECHATRTPISVFCSLTQGKHSDRGQRCFLQQTELDDKIMSGSDDLLTCSPMLGKESLNTTYQPLSRYHCNDEIHNQLVGETQMMSYLTTQTEVIGSDKRFEDVEIEHSVSISNGGVHNHRCQVDKEKRGDAEILSMPDQNFGSVTGIGEVSRKNINNKRTTSISESHSLSWMSEKMKPPKKRRYSLETDNWEDVATGGDKLMCRGKFGPLNANITGCSSKLKNISSTIAKDYALNRDDFLSHAIFQERACANQPIKINMNSSVRSSEIRYCDTVMKTFHNAGYTRLTYTEPVMSVARYGETSKTIGSSESKRADSDIGSAVNHPIILSGGETSKTIGSSESKRADSDIGSAVNHPIILGGGETSLSMPLARIEDEANACIVKLSQNTKMVGIEDEANARIVKLSQNTEMVGIGDDASACIVKASVNTKMVEIEDKANARIVKASVNTEMFHDESPPIRAAIQETDVVRKSKRRNRGQRYMALISEGIIQPSKERLAARCTESSSVFENNRSEETRGTTACHVTAQPANEAANLKATSKQGRGFDLEAHIATLPPCSVEALSKRRGRGVKSSPQTSPSKVSQTSPSQDVEKTVVKDSSNGVTSPPVPAAIITTTSAEATIGSRKRKARRHAITRLLPLNADDQVATKEGATPHLACKIPRVPISTAPFAKEKCIAIGSISMKVGGDGNAKDTEEASVGQNVLGTKSRHTWLGHNGGLVQNTDAADVDVSFKRGSSATNVSGATPSCGDVIDSIVVTMGMSSCDARQNIESSGSRFVVNSVAAVSLNCGGVGRVSKAHNHTSVEVMSRGPTVRSCDGGSRVNKDVSRCFSPCTFVETSGIADMPSSVQRTASGPELLSRFNSPSSSYVSSSATPFLPSPISFSFSSHVSSCVLSSATSAPLSSILSLCPTSAVFVTDSVPSSASSKLSSHPSSIPLSVSSPISFDSQEKFVKFEENYSKHFSFNQSSLKPKNHSSKLIDLLNVKPKNLRHQNHSKLLLNEASFSSTTPVSSEISSPQLPAFNPTECFKTATVRFALINNAHDKVGGTAAVNVNLNDPVRENVGTPEKINGKNYDINENIPLNNVDTKVIVADDNVPSCNSTSVSELMNANRSALPYDPVPRIDPVAKDTSVSKGRNYSKLRTELFGSDGGECDGNEMKTPIQKEGYCLSERGDVGRRSKLSSRPQYDEYRSVFTVAINDAIDKVLISENFLLDERSGKPSGARTDDSSKVEGRVGLEESEDMVVSSGFQQDTRHGHFLRNVPVKNYDEKGSRLRQDVSTSDVSVKQSSPHIGTAMSGVSN